MTFINNFDVTLQPTFFFLSKQSHLISLPLKKKMGSILTHCHT